MNKAATIAVYEKHDYKMVNIVFQHNKIPQNN